MVTDPRAERPQKKLRPGPRESLAEKPGRSGETGPELKRYAGNTANTADTADTADTN